MNEYYEILGLKPGASKEEVEENYRDLLRVWNPDNFANGSPLQKKAGEKIKGLDEAYEKLIIYLTKVYEQTSQNKSERNIKPEERDSYSVYGEAAKQRDAQSKEDISSEALTLVFFVFALYLGFKFLPTSSWIAHIVIAAISGGLGGTIGYAVVQCINRLNVAKKQKVMIAWAIGIIGLFVFSSMPVLLQNPKPKLRPITPEELLAVAAQTEVQKGRIFLAKGSYPEAIDAFSKAIELNPHDVVAADAYDMRGLAYWGLKDYKHAIEDFSKEIEIEPEKSSGYSGRGGVNNDLGNYQLAIRDFDKSIELNPQHSAIYNDRGLSYDHLSNYQQAIRDYDRAIELNPQDSDTYYNRGLSYDHLSNYQQAIRDYDRAIELNPQNSDAYYARGLSYADLGNHEQYVIDCIQAARLGNKNAQDSLSSRGIVWQRD